MYMTNRQPYVFEGGMQEENHRRFYLRPPKDTYVMSLKVAVIAVKSIEDLAECPQAGETFFALENDSR